MNARALFLAVALAGCASQGGLERAGYHERAGRMWYVDAPEFTMRAVEWNHVAGADARKRLGNLCGDPGMTGDACAIRLRESGLCLVYSIHSENEAKRFRELTGETFYAHELGHCGKGMPRPGGWSHLDRTTLGGFR